MSDKDRLLNKSIQGHDLSIHQNTCCKRSVWMIITVILSTCLLEGYSIHFSSPVLPRLVDKHYAGEVFMTEKTAYLYAVRKIFRTWINISIL